MVSKSSHVDGILGLRTVWQMKMIGLWTMFIWSVGFGILSTVAAIYFFPPVVRSEFKTDIGLAFIIQHKISEATHFRGQYWTLKPPPVVQKINAAQASAEHKQMALKIIDEEIAAWFRLLYRYIYAFIGGGTLAAVALYFMGSRQEQRATSDQYVRGAELLDEKSLAKILKREPGRLLISKLRIPTRYEIQPTLIMGRPRQGKSTLLKSLIDQITQSELGKLVIFDCKGDFTATHFRPGVDQIFAPAVDKRSIRWTLFNDIGGYSDIVDLAACLVPDSKAKDPLWDNGARAILTGLLLHCWHSGKKSNAYLAKCAALPAKDLHAILAATPGGETGAAILAKYDSTTAFSFFVTIQAKLAPVQLLAHCDGDFSIKKWLADKHTGGLYISATPADLQTIAPVLAVFLHTLLTANKSMPDDLDRRIYYMLDELAELPKIPGLSGALNFGPSKGMCFLLGFQSYAQIDDRYGQEVRKAMVSAAGTHIIYSVGETETATRASEIIGSQEVLEQRQTLSTGIVDNRDGGSSSEQTTKKLLVLPDEIKDLPTLNCYVKFVAFPACRIVLQYKPYTSVNPARVADERFNLDNYIYEMQCLAAPIPVELPADPPPEEPPPQPTGGATGGGGVALSPPATAAVPAPARAAGSTLFTTRQPAQAPAQAQAPAAEPETEQEQDMDY